MLPHHRLTGDGKGFSKGRTFCEGKPHHGVTARSAYSLPLLAALFLGLEQGAQACVYCNTASTWQAFPPVFSWALIMLAWYFGYSLVVTMDGGQLLYIRKLPGSLGWIGPALLLAIVAFGPILMFIFGILCLINFVVSLWPYPLLGWSSWLRWQVRVIGVIFIVALGYTAVTEYTAFSKMDQADIILKWSGTALSSMMLENLKEQVPDSIPLYRKILREGKSYTRSRAATHLAEVGNREEDVPLLIEAFADEYRRGPNGDYFAVHEVSEALQKMTGLNLPPETSPEVWREKWNALHEGQ